MTALKTAARHLRAVTDGEAPAVIATVAPRGRRAALAAEHETARRAAGDPEVVEERTVAVTSAMHRLAVPGADRREILNALAEAIFTLGYMNGAADQRNSAYLDLADGTLAEVLVLEAAERRDARQAERATLAVAKAAKP